MSPAPPPVKLLPPNLFLLSALIMLLLGRFFPIVDLLPYPISLATGLPLFVAGIVGTWWGSSAFARARTNIHPFRDPQILVIDGLFRISRNPMYLGLLCALGGIWLMIGALSPFFVILLFFWVIDSRFIPYEEIRMRHVFGAAYEQYAKRTRRWM